jgi:hypothetical protein
MSDHIQDELWPHFAPIWTDLRNCPEDVFRIVAMMTREEREAANEVLKVVRDGSSYLSAARTYLQFFNSDQSWGPLAVEDKWQPEDFRSIKTALAAWFA